MLTDGLEWCGLLVDYCDVFISCLDSHSDGTHSLQRIHCWTSDGMLHFSKSDEETNSSTSWMASGWAHFYFCINKASWKACVCTLAARRLTASSRRRCSSGVLGQLLDRRVLVALSGGVGWGGWLRGGSELGSPPAHVTDEYPHEHKYLQLLRFYRDESNINTQTSQTV